MARYVIPNLDEQKEEIQDEIKKEAHN